uniref:HTH psq-type domain-containing protein n=1 Tax=Trichuris muris TaxID=70415 RepID=A0A5S6Q983_TRIMR
MMEALDREETGRSLCDKYGITKAALCTILKRKGKIIQVCPRKINEEVGTPKRKLTKPSKLEEVEQARYVWFVQNRSVGNSVSGPLASQVCLDKFKKRHGIRTHEI